MILSTSNINARMRMHFAFYKFVIVSRVRSRWLRGRSAFCLFTAAHILCVLYTYAYMVQFIDLFNNMERKKKSDFLSTERSAL